MTNINISNKMIMTNPIIKKTMKKVIVVKKIFQMLKLKLLNKLDYRINYNRHKNYINQN